MCPDFLLNNTVCKHIHLLHRYKEANQDLPEASVTDLQLQNLFKDLNRNQESEMEHLLSTVSKTNKIESFHLQRQKVKTNLLTIMNDKENCKESDMDTFMYLERHLSTKRNAFQSL